MSSISASSSSSSLSCRLWRRSMAPNSGFFKDHANHWAVAASLSPGILVRSHQSVPLRWRNTHERGSACFREAVPRAILWRIVLNGCLVYVMVIVVLFCMGLVEDVLNSSYPISTVLQNATSSQSATTDLLLDCYYSRSPGTWPSQHRSLG